MSELEFIYRVAFNEPPLEFTPEQVGCKVSRLWKRLEFTPIR